MTVAALCRYHRLHPDPTTLYGDALHHEAYQAVEMDQRRSNKEELYRGKFREEALRLYPGIPQGDLDDVVALATEVASGRVARSQKLSLTSLLWHEVVEQARAEL